MIEHTCGGRGAVPCPACTVRGAQAAFAADWREQHPTQMFGKSWCCPLCERVVQTTVTFAGYHADDVESHQRGHGADWQRYMQAGQAPGGSGEG